MPQGQVLINQAGPLPVKTSVELGSVGDAMLTVAGSVWTQNEGSLTGFNVLFNGAEVGTCRIWSNGPATHRATVPQHIPIELNAEWPSPEEPPTYTVELVPMNGTLSDVNDWFQVVISA